MSFAIDLGNTQSDTSIPVFCGQRTIRCLLNSCNNPRPDFPTIITLSLECIEVQASSLLLGTLHLCMKHLSPLMQKKKQGVIDPCSNTEISIDLLLFFELIFNEVIDSLCIFVPAQEPLGEFCRLCASSTWVRGSLGYSITKCLSNGHFFFLPAHEN